MCSVAAIALPGLATRVSRNSSVAASLDQLIRQPVNLLLSGPSAGVGAMQHLASGIGENNLVSMEIGGTSCDVMLMHEGRVAITPGVQYTLIYRPTDDMVKNLIGSRASLPADLNLITRTPRVEGFYSMSFAEMFEVQKKLYTDVATLRKPVADFLGVRQYLVETNGFAWREHSTALPLVTAGQSPVFTATVEIPTMLTAEDYDPRRFVFFDEGARASVNASTNASAKVTELTIETHRVSFDVESDRATMAVIAQAHYPAWKARVGEKEAPILKANGAFQALNIPAGTHRVELVYRDRKFTIGLAISLVAFVAIGWFGFRREVTRK